MTFKVVPDGPQIGDLTEVTVSGRHERKGKEGRKEGKERREGEEGRRGGRGGQERKERYLALVSLKIYAADVSQTVCAHRHS